jgi:hypothetical protein
MVYFPGSRYPAPRSSCRVYPYNTLYVILFPLLHSSLTDRSLYLLPVHALYDRNRRVTATLFVLFLVENVVMAVSLIKVVPAVRFDTICTVIYSPTDLVIFAYDYTPL